MDNIPTVEPIKMWTDRQQWSAWVDKMIRAEENTQPEVEDWVVTEDGPQWRQG